jgi:hypothetical protein
MPRTLTALQIGFDPDIKFVDQALYSLEQGKPVLNPMDTTPDDSDCNGRTLYRTTDHGQTWVPVAKFRQLSGGYKLEWFVIEKSVQDFSSSR